MNADTAPSKAYPVLAYIGLGLMGGPMTRHLRSKGYPIRGHDISAVACSAAAAWGVQVCASATEAAAGADLVILNLPTVYAVEDVMFGGHAGPADAAGTGLVRHLKPGQTVVDFSTIPPERGREFIARLKAEAGCAWIDAPVSGGPAAAGQGSLTVMAGAHDADLTAAVRTLMDDVSARFTVVGAPGSGLVAKALNQLIVGSLHAVLGEAAVLAEQAGIDAALVPTALAGGFADGPLMQSIFPRMLARDFAPRGYVRQLLKDLDMVHDFAAGLKVPTPMMSQAQTLYRLLAHLGHSELDTGAIVKVFER